MNAFLDTLDLARRMEDRGISPQHAEGIAEAIKTVWLSYDEASRREIATSAEVRETELNLQKEIEQVRSDLRETELRLQKEIDQVRAEIQKSKYSLLRWQIGGWRTLAAIMAKGFGWIGF